MMREVVSYLVERDGKQVWLVQGAQPTPTDIVITHRRMIVAEEGKTLYLGDSEIAPAIWTDMPLLEFTEGDIPPEPEEEIINTEEDT